MRQLGPTHSFGSVTVRLRRRHGRAHRPRFGVGYTPPKVLWRGPTSQNPYRTTEANGQTSQFGNAERAHGYQQRTLSSSQLVQRAQQQVAQKTQAAQDRGLDFNPAANGGKGAAFDPNNFSDPNNPNGVKDPNSPNYGLSVNPATGQPYDPSNPLDPNNPNYAANMAAQQAQQQAAMQASYGGYGGGYDGGDEGGGYEPADYEGDDAGEGYEQGYEDDGGDGGDYADEYAAEYGQYMSGPDDADVDQWTHLACVDVPHPAGALRVTGVGFDFASALATAASLASAVASSPVMSAVLPPGTASALAAVNTIAKAQATGGDAAAKQAASQFSGPGGQRLQKALASDSKSSKASSTASASSAYNGILSA